MGTLIDSGRFRECLDYFESLPESLKGEKVLQLQHLRAALGTGDPGPCKRAMADFRSIVAHGPSLDQNLIAVYLVLENFDSALIAVDGLNQYVDDPYLDIQRSLIFLKAGNYSASRSAAEKVIATDPMLPTAYVVLMTVGIRQHGNVLISDALDRMQRCGAGTIDFEGIESSLEYAEFAASSEYEALKRKYH